jgi:hypothetical protein
MAKYVSLNPSGLPEEFDLELHSEKPVISVVESENHIKINYIFPGFTVGDNERRMEDQTLSFKEVGISGAGFVSKSGKPLLPSFGRFVQIPPGCEYEVSYKKSKPVKFEDILITPAQEMAIDRADEIGEFEYDAEAYEEDTLYPAEVVQVGEPQNLDDYKALLIHVRPLQYSAGKRQLVGYSNIKVIIKLSPREAGDEDVEGFSLIDPPVNREGYGNLVLNPRRRIVERMPVAPISVPKELRPRGPEFLIIYEEKLKSAAELLANWKNHKGLSTNTVSIASVGNSVAKIKKYIRVRRKYPLSRLRYVLLLGDVEAIKSEQHPESLFVPYCPASFYSDHYFFTPRDPEDPDDCVLPWLSGGRIPVKSLDEAKMVVKQIIDYEQTPPCDPDYYRRMSFAAYFQDNGPQDGRADRAYMKTMESIRDHMISIGFNVERVYVSNNPNPQKYKDGTMVPAEVRNAIVDADYATDMLISETSEGQLAVGHRDHGGKAGWVHPSFVSDHLASISSRYPSIFYSINCLTGRFDDIPSDSFAEDIMLLNGGAPSLLAATQCSGTWRNDSLMKALFDAMWPGVIATFPGTTASYAIQYNRLGDILNYAKSYLLVAHGANSGVKHHFEIYHVVGDPTLQLWAEEPAHIRLRAYISRNNLNIHVSPAPAEAVVTIWYQGKLVKHAAVCSSRISIPISDLRLAPSRFPAFRRYLDVCVSGLGYRYTQTRLKL